MVEKKAWAVNGYLGLIVILALGVAGTHFVKQENLFAGVPLKKPAVCAQSIIKNRLCSLHSLPTSSKGNIVPLTLEAWVIITAFVLDLIWRYKSLVRSSPLLLQRTVDSSTPFSASEARGRITALCSIEETMTWSPGFNNLLFRIRVQNIKSSTSLIPLPCA